MSKNKLQRLAEVKTFPNVLQPVEVKLGFKTQLNWQKYFGNNNPITLELACGKGDYALALAEMHPNRNFIGIDIKGVRIWRGAKTALEKKLTNVAFLRMQIENLEYYFPLPPPQVRRGKGVVMKNLNAHNTPSTKKLSQKSQTIITDIWLTFPDPFPKKRHIKHRLTSPRFLKMYKKILQPNGVVHLKTDDLNLFNYSIETAIAEGWKIKESINNIYAFNNLPLELKIQTFYENQHLKAGKQIHYLCFIPPRPAGEGVRG